MVVNFKSRKLEKQLSNAAEIKKAFGELAKKIVQRLAEIRAADNLAILMQLPAARCHPLTGDRMGEWAVTISGNYRLIFEIDQDPVPQKADGAVDCIRVTKICLIGTVDYH